MRGQPRVLLNAIGRGDPETLNFDNPDPFAEGIDLVRGSARAMKIDHVLSNGFGFGGVNASLVLRKMQERQFLENEVGGSAAQRGWEYRELDWRGLTQLKEWQRMRR